MPIEKILFETMDVLFDRRQNANIIPKCNKLRGCDACIVNNVVYNNRSNAETADYYYYPLLDNLYEYPVMIYIHGGGFVGGDKKYRRALGAWFASLGFFTIVINYSLCDNAKFPMQIRECVDALNHVENIKDKYRLDCTKIFVSGDSAGAYYAAMLGAVASTQRLQIEFGVHTETKISALILNCGIYDLKSAMSNKSTAGLCDRICYDYTGVHVKDIEQSEFYPIISPYNLIDSDFPETFLIHAKNDVFCKSQGNLFKSRLLERGIKFHEYYSVSAQDNHCFSLNWRAQSSVKVMKAIKDYLESKIFN